VYLRKRVYNGGYTRVYIKRRGVHNGGYTRVYLRVYRKGGMLRRVYYTLWENGRHAAQSLLSSFGRMGGMLRRVLPSLPV